ILIASPKSARRGERTPKRKRRICAGNRGRVLECGAVAPAFTVGMQIAFGVQTRGRAMMNLPKSLCSTERISSDQITENHRPARLCHDYLKLNCRRTTAASST